MEFTAEIIRTTQRKLVSNDNQYEIVFRTDNPQILDLGKLKGNELFDISITLHNNTEHNANKENEGDSKI